MNYVTIPAIEPHIVWEDDLRQKIFGEPYKVSIDIDETITDPHHTCVEKFATRHGNLPFGHMVNAYYADVEVMKSCRIQFFSEIASTI